MFVEVGETRIINSRHQEFMSMHISAGVTILLCTSVDEISRFDLSCKWVALDMDSEQA